MIRQSLYCSQKRGLERERGGESNQVTRERLCGKKEVLKKTKNQDLTTNNDALTCPLSILFFSPLFFRKKKNIQKRLRRREIESPAS